MSVNKELGVYIHIPFCLRKCKYCDFLSFTCGKEKRKVYVESLCEEIRGFFQREKEYLIKTVYLGGGTPSILEPEWTTEILRVLREWGKLAPDAEISMEANPGTLTKEKLQAYHDAGINRLSIGLQSTEEKELEYLGRIHCYEDFLTGFQMAREAGFDNINVDLMSAVPYQTMESWQRTLDRVIALDPEHISAYSLIVEEGTPFYEDEKLEDLIPDEDTERLMYEKTKGKLEKYGYDRYEVSNYAKAGKECHHNMIYWKRKDYIGFGLGASSCLNEVRFKNTDSMEEYLKQPFVSLEEREEREVLSIEEQMAEEMILGLRMIQGVSREAFAKRYKKELDAVYGSVIEKYKKEGLLTEEAGWIRFTEKGLDLSNLVLCEFI